MSNSVQSEFNPSAAPAHYFGTYAGGGDVVVELNFKTLMADIFLRSKFNPILKPTEGGWWKIYNPGAAIDDNGRVHLFPRVVRNEGDLVSQIAHAVGTDDEHFTLQTALAIAAQTATEKRGVEDARVTLIENKYHMTFSAFDGVNVDLHTAISNHLDGPWLRCGPALPDFRFISSGGVRVRWVAGAPIEKKNVKGEDRRSKSGALFPCKISGRYFMLFGEFRMWLAVSEDGQKFEAQPGPFLAPRKDTDYFDNAFVEMGPPPILIDEGWLVLYHGVNRQFQYQLGYLILDRDDPRRILVRSSEPIFGPREPYEIADGPIDVVAGAASAAQTLSDRELKEFYRSIHHDNVMPQVVFCSGAIARNKILRLYYGAGDTSVCTASASLTDVFKSSGR